MKEKEKNRLAGNPDTDIFSSPSQNSNPALAVGDPFLVEIVVAPHSTRITAFLVCANTLMAINAVVIVSTFMKVIKSPPWVG
jgi:hypothetical protein